MITVRGRTGLFLHCDLHRAFGDLAARLQEAIPKRHRRIIALDTVTPAFADRSEELNFFIFSHFFILIFLFFCIFFIFSCFFNFLVFSFFHFSLPGTPWALPTSPKTSLSLI